ncbi:MAG TPA: DoxX-like family protein, partial [Gemmatimonadaceae bacterium]
RAQDPELHQRWDLRFSEIDYLPRSDDESPQRFHYSTRIGFGLRIDGQGESTGTRNGPTGERTSALRFWSNDFKSLIRDGSGYWRYVTAPGGVRFITSYNYTTRFGLAGRALDAVVFRPLMGWATAWSFDRLRLWVENEIDPAVSMQQSVVHAIARCAIAGVFLYQGLVPKLIFRHSSEVRMLTESGVDPRATPSALFVIGLAEVILGVFMLIAWRPRWPFAIVLMLMAAALLEVAIVAPYTLSNAFNPVVLNISVAALAAIGWLTSRDLPSASRCYRAPQREFT